MAKAFQSKHGICPGQLWQWSSTRINETRFVVLVLRPYAATNLEEQWSTSVVFDNRQTPPYAPYDDVNYWPDDPHWKLLSDA